MITAPYLARVDHYALVYLKNCKDSSKLMARWYTILENANLDMDIDIVSKMAENDFVIQYRKGGQNANADGLSRIPIRTDNDTQDTNQHIIPNTNIHIQSLINNSHNINQIHNAQQYTLAQDQDADIELNELKGHLKNQLRPSVDDIRHTSEDTRIIYSHLSNLILENDIIYKTKLINDKLVKFAVIPVNNRKQLLNYYHSIKCAHYSSDKTLSSMQTDRIYWPNLKNDVSEHIKQCHICTEVKRTSHTIKAPLKPIPASFFGQRIHLDFAGPLPITPNGNRFILFIIDAFTNWCEAIALPSMTAEITAKTLFSYWISRFGSPLSLHSDAATNFQSKLFRELCAILNINQTRSTSWHSQSDGKAERIILNCKTLMTCIMQGSDLPWDQIIDYALFAYRTSQHSSTDILRVIFFMVESYICH